MSEVQPVLAQIFPTHLRGSFCDAPRELVQEEEAEAGEAEAEAADKDKDKGEEGIWLLSLLARDSLDVEGKGTEAGILAGRRAHADDVAQ